MKDLDIIIPVVNEARNIEELARRIDFSLTSANIKYRMIFVDDHSTDYSVSEIKRISKSYPVVLHIKQGKGGKAFSILEGSRLAKSEYIAMIDGDLQYPPEVLPEMYKLASNHGVVVANRLGHKTSTLRKIGSKMNRLIFERYIHGFRVDTQSGLKMFKREVISHLEEVDVTGWTLDLPLLRTALELGYSIGSLDIAFEERKNGKSKVNFLKTSFEIALHSLKLKFKKRKIYKIEAVDQDSVVGSGFAHKGKRFITHTKLPLEKTAMITFSGWQKLVLLASLLIIALGIYLSAITTAIAIVAFLTLLYFLDFIFNFYVLFKSLRNPPEVKIIPEEIGKLKNKDLPIYTILCPLYREAKVLPHFIEAIDCLDWPKDKLDVLLLLEEDDEETREAVKKLDLPSHFKSIVVPHSFPKTKPKACNFGLAYAKGDYVVIYDAEDRPEKDQLKKAYIAFEKMGSQYVCLQSKLNYFNTHQNILTRLFTAEYSLWFDLILPGLQSVEAAIPLGGTSNHFRRNDLVGLHAWDSFNVTEDCDLGVRIFKEGYKTAIMDSVTYEEANSRIFGWIRQRSRWIKGYLQTYLVHMRRPLSFIKSHGIQAFIFQLVIGMRMVFILINPILWLATLSYFVIYPVVGPAIESLYPSYIFYPAVILLIFGNFMYLYNYMIGCAKRKQWSVIKYVYLVPVYWLMTSVAAVVAFYQLFAKPHYWEKTQHGHHLDREEKNRLKNAKRLLAEKARTDQIEKVKSWARGGFVGGGALVLSTMAANVMNFIYNAYLGRSVNLAEFGTVSLIGNILSVASIFTSSFGKTIVYKTAYLLGKYKKPSSEFLKRLEKWGWTYSFVLTLLWMGLIPLLSKYFHSDMLPFLLFTPTLSVGVISSIYSGYITGSLKFATSAILTFIETFTKLGFAILFIRINQISLVYASIPISAVITFFATWFMVSRIEKVVTGDKNADRFPLGFFGASILNKISSVVFLNLDVILAKHFLSPNEAGRYALLSLTGKVVYFLGTLFTQFITPLVSTREGEGEKSRGVFYKLLLASASASIFGLIVVGFLGSITLPFLFGDKAIGISAYSLLYGYAMVSFTVSSSIITYHQIKKQYAFPVLGILASLSQCLLIFNSSKDIGGLSSSVAIASLIQLSLIGILHIFYKQFVAAGWFFKEFLGLFRGLIGMYKPEENKLRILILNWRDTKHVWAGGAEVYVHEIAKRWVKDGHRVMLFCGNDQKSKMNEIVDGVNIIRRGGFYTVYLWVFLYYIMRLRSKFDVIVDCENGIPFFTPLFSRLPKILVVFHVHSEVFKKHLIFPFSTLAIFLEGKLMPFLYRSANIATVSASSKADIVKMGWADKGRIEVLNPGIDHKSYKRTKKSPVPLVVYIGRLKHYKNVDVAINAFSLVANKYKEARLAIAGKGEEERYLKSWVRRLNIGDKVNFLGYISDGEKIKLLGRAWVVIQPSSFEGWGITVIEANACGTPVVASKIKGLTDSVVDGVTGILTPVGNPVIAARALESFIADYKFRKYMSANAHKWSLNFSWRKTANEFMKLALKVKDPGKDLIFVKVPTLAEEE